MLSRRWTSEPVGRLKVEPESSRWSCNVLTCTLSSKSRVAALVEISHQSHEQTLRFPFPVLNVDGSCCRVCVDFTQPTLCVLVSLVFPHVCALISCFSVSQQQERLAWAFNPPTHPHTHTAPQWQLTGFHLPSHHCCLTVCVEEVSSPAVGRNAL